MRLASMIQMRFWNRESYNVSQGHLLVQLFYEISMPAQFRADFVVGLCEDIVGLCEDPRWEISI